MKNLTGSSLQWKGKTYNPGEDIPEAIAQEMGLATMPEQVAGQQAQSGSEPPPVSDPYDIQALTAAQSVSPPIVLVSREIDPVSQSAPNVSFAAVVDFGSQTTPVNLKPLETGEQPPPQSAEVPTLSDLKDPELSGGKEEAGKSEEPQQGASLETAIELEQDAATAQEEALTELDEAIAGEEPPPETQTTTTRKRK